MTTGRRTARPAVVALAAALAVGAVVFSFASPAAAEEDAGVLANRATDMFRDPARRDEAIALYHRAASLATEALRGEILVNLGKAYGAMERLPESWAYLWEVRRSDPRRAAELDPILRYLEERLAASHARVTVAAEPEGATVAVTSDGRQHRFAAPLTWWFPAGEHRVRVERAGFESAELTVTARPGAEEQRVVRLRPVERPRASAPEPTLGARQDEESPHRPVAAWKWALLGGGAAATLAGVGTWTAAYLRADDLNGAHHDDRAAFDARWDEDVVPLQTTSYVLWGLGGAATIAGVVLVLLDTGSDAGDASGGGSVDAAGSRGALVPLAAPGALGAAWQGTF